MKVRIERLSNGRYKAGGYIFTKHFIDKWRERNVNSPSDEKVVADALKRINYSFLLKVKPDGQELRVNHDLVFVIHNRLVITVMYTFTRHRVEETSSVFNTYEEKISC